MSFTVGETVLLNEGNMQIKTAITSVLLFFMLPIYAATETLDKIVAVVNNDVITQREVQDKIDLIKKQAVMAHQPLPADAELKKQVLEKLIDRELQMQVVKRAKIEVTDVELNNAVQDIAERNHLSLEQLKQSLAKDGITFEVFRQQIHDEVLLGKVERQAVNPNVSITDEEIAEFLKQGDGNGASKEYHVLDILVPVSETPKGPELQNAHKLALTVEQKLRAGAKPEEVIHANNLQQQDLDWRKLQDLPSIFIAAVTPMKSGGISRPIQAPNGFHIIKLLAVRDVAAKEKLTSEQAREILYHRRLNENLQTWLQGLRKQSYIKIEE